MKKCFKYRDKEEYFNEIKILNEKIQEINEYKNENNFLIEYDKYFQEQSQSDINFRKMKNISLFNQNLTDIILNDFLTKISNDLTNFNEISIMTKKIKELSLAKNQIKEINLSKIFNLFPNLEKLDLSLNNISSILIENEKNKNSEFPPLKILDLSFNNISNLNIISKLKDILKCEKIYYYGNPILNEKEKKTKEIKNLQKNSNKKNLLFLEYINYSFTKEINDFSDLIYFRTTKKGDYYRNYKNNILFLNNKNLYSIPKLKDNDEDINYNYPEENNKNDYNIIFLNSNKIKELNNLYNLNNLYELYLQNNKIQLLSFLPLTLKKLDLSLNYISDLNEIEKNQSLEWINLDFNNIYNITSLLSLNRLKELYCSNNLIESISEDDYLKLKNLTQLEIFDFTINSITFSSEDFRMKIIFNCPNLIKLNKKIVSEKERKEANELLNGKLTIEVLEKRVKENYESTNITIDLNQLIELDLSRLNLRDEAFLFDKKKYPNLKRLNISKNYFTTLEIFGPLPELAELNLSSNFLYELFPKKYCKNFKIRFNFANLKILDLSSNKLADIIGIINFSKLKKLNLKDNYISKIDSIDKLNDLNYINISNNKLRSCEKSNLGILPSIKTILCDNNFLKSINCFEKFGSLENLSFNTNKITDLSCLDKLTQLKKLNRLSLINNPITHIENYRKIIIFYFQGLKCLDNKEIIPPEKTLFSKNTNENNKQIFMNSNSNLNMHSKKDEMVKLYDTFSQGNKYLKMKSNKNESSKNLDYSIKGNKLFAHPKSARKFVYNFDGIKSPKRSLGNFGSHLDLNIKILQSKKDKDFNRFSFLSKRRGTKKNMIPALKLSDSKKYDEIIFLNKNKYNNKYKNKMERPFSGHNRSNFIKTKPITSNRNDYFSIVMNSFGNDDFTPLVTLKNFNIKKINF